ncbi:MAG TPA: sigma-54-dependent Fis family transcriptional regulator [Colwellia sp.]|mgnify:FL=1|nr:sigma-54-dependent Fis family transcriptional regulator [Colwellia sp.]
MNIVNEAQNTYLPLLVLVDDEQDILTALERVLRGLHINIQSFSSALAALEFCHHNQPEIVISDQQMPEIEGCTFLNEIKALWPKSQRIILSAHQDFDKISKAFNSGTVDRFICKPWNNKELKFIITKALDNTPLKSTEVAEKGFINEPINFHGMVAADEAMKELFVSIRHAATTNAPIFITGETGTGKELVAKACHKESYQQSQPFIAVNCANFTKHLMESQLFGHTKGAFTGATTSQEGLFAAAKSGMLFLDEITTLSTTLQAKLLRVVQEREFTPLGTNKVEKFHAQLISASSNSIRQAVLDGNFREDLYYRLNVITFCLPPLRDRGGDIVLIARYFLKKYSKIENKLFVRFSKGCLQIICQYDWPGNIRQLENIIHGMVILNTGDKLTSEMIIKALSSTIGLSDNILPVSNRVTRPAIRSEERSETPIEQTSNPLATNTNTEIIPLWLTEKNAIENAINYCQGNIPQAAALLEVSPSTLYRKKLSW